MNRTDLPDFQTAMRALFETFGKTISDVAIAEWWDALQGYLLSDVLRVLRGWRNGSRFAPKPAEIRARLEEFSTEKRRVSTALAPESRCSYADHGQQCENRWTVDFGRKLCSYHDLVLSGRAQPGPAPASRPRLGPLLPARLALDTAPERKVRDVYGDDTVDFLKANPQAGYAETDPRAYPGLTLPPEIVADIRERRRLASSEVLQVLGIRAAPKGFAPLSSEARAIADVLPAASTAGSVAAHLEPPAHELPPLEAYAEELSTEDAD